MIEELYVLVIFWRIGTHRFYVVLRVDEDTV